MCRQYGSSSKRYVQGGATNHRAEGSAAKSVRPIYGTGDLEPLEGELEANDAVAGLQDGKQFESDDRQLEQTYDA